jgi:hypothetical protein
MFVYDDLPSPNSDPASVVFLVIGAALIWHAVNRIRGGEPLWQRYSERPRSPQPWLPRRLTPLLQLWVGSLAIISSIVLLAK